MSNNRRDEIVIASYHRAMQEGNNFVPSNLKINFNKEMTTLTIEKPDGMTKGQYLLFTTGPAHAGAFTASRESLISTYSILFKLSIDDQRIKDIVAYLIDNAIGKRTTKDVDDIIRPILLDLVKECVLFSEEELNNGTHPADRFLSYLKDSFERDFV